MAIQSSCLAYGSDRYPAYGPIRLQDRVGGISCFQALRVGLREGLYWCWSEVAGEGELSRWGAGLLRLEDRLSPVGPCLGKDRLRRSDKPCHSARNLLSRSGFGWLFHHLRVGRSADLFGCQNHPRKSNFVLLYCPAKWQLATHSLNRSPAIF